MLRFVIKTIVEDHRADLVRSEAAISINYCDHSVHQSPQAGVCPFQFENARPYFIRRHPGITVFRNSSGHVCASVAASNLVGLASYGETASCEDSCNNNQQEYFVHRIVMILFWQAPSLRLGIRKRHSVSHARVRQRDEARCGADGLPERDIQVRRILGSLRQGILRASFRDQLLAVLGQRSAWARQEFALVVPSQFRFASTISRLMLCH